MSWPCLHEGQLVGNLLLNQATHGSTAGRAFGPRSILLCPTVLQKIAFEPKKTLIDLPWLLHYCNCSAHLLIPHPSPLMLGVLWSCAQATRSLATICRFVDSTDRPQGFAVLEKRLALKLAMTRLRDYSLDPASY